MSEAPNTPGAWTVCACGAVIADAVAHTEWHTSIEADLAELHDTGGPTP